MILTAGGEPLAVIDGDERVRGLLTLGLIEQLLADEAAADETARTAARRERAHALSGAARVSAAASQRAGDAGR